jgi:hypothetical protein
MGDGELAWSKAIHAALETLHEAGPRIGAETASGIRQRYLSYASVDDASLKAAQSRSVDPRHP